MRTVRSPELTSSSPMPVRCTSRMSWRISASPPAPSMAPPALSVPAGAGFRALSAGRATAVLRLPRLWLGLVTGEDSHQPAQCQFIACRAETLDHPDGGPGDQRSVPESLARVGVTQVHLDHRDPGGQHRVPQGHARVGQSARVEKDPVRAAIRRVKSVDQHTLVVGLPALDLAPELRGEGLEEAVDVEPGSPDRRWRAPGSPAR